MQNNNEFKGYSLFNDVEDAENQRYNRARILMNIMEDHSNKERDINGTGLILCMGYFNSLPEADRPAVYHKLAELLATKKGL